MEIETAYPSHFEQPVSTLEFALQATYHFSQKAILRHYACHCSIAYFLNLIVTIIYIAARINSGSLGVGDNCIRMLFVNEANRGGCIG